MCLDFFDTCVSEQIYALLTLQVVLVGKLPLPKGYRLPKSVRLLPVAFASSSALPTDRP